MGVGLYLTGRYDPPTGSATPGGALGDLQTWLQEHGGDAVAVQEAMLHWLGSMGQVVLENLQKDRTGFMVAMPLGHHYPYHGPVVTPLGPRDKAWFEALANDPWRGSDFFAWWEPGLNA